MSLLSFDLETHLIQPGLLAPPIVCGSFAARDQLRVNQLGLARDGLLFRQTSSLVTLLADRRGAFDAVATNLHEERVWVGANIAYDFACVLAAQPDLMPLIWRAYEEGRVDRKSVV